LLYNHKTKNKMKTNFRILNQEGNVKYTGTITGSWFTLEDAKKLVNRSNGESIYEYSMKTMSKLWEVF
jgi:hypothetical protein